MPKKNLKNKKILITAGPTREYLDPVRYLINPSSGEMGFALARVLNQWGATVTVVAGPTAVAAPSFCDLFPVTTALQMFSQVQKKLPHMDAFIATAAVADFRFKAVLKEKMKKGNKKYFSVTLVRNPDILAEAGRWKSRQKGSRPLLIGFSLETENLEKNAKEKLVHKNLDLIIGNTPASFSKKVIQPFWLEKSGFKKSFPKMSKEALSKKIAGWLAQTFERRSRCE